MGLGERSRGGTGDLIAAIAKRAHRGHAVSMRFLALLAAPALLAAAPQDQSLTAPGQPEDWVAYHKTSSEDGTRDYAYDRTSVRRAGDIVSVRSKAVSPATTLYFTMDIDCAKSLASETGTVIINAKGGQEVLPASDLVANYAIGKGSFAEDLQKLLCK